MSLQLDKLVVKSEEKKELPPDKVEAIPPLSEELKQPQRHKMIAAGRSVTRQPIFFIM